ncbi:nucleoside hydrolase [Variovorax sp. OV329]|uniref:nucleoside hydrolase n=1 Tax=Variovorax sp. OV329 TaxID=1882825 RepID=UPI0008EF3F77|nr:nucleoside hydrolase [Variovorax sp. OV329]SFM88307.1 Inosine-uridine nucleoside N-ribohydrolase [Variovorax sp. OV329]
MSAQRRKLIIDQDTHGPASTNLQSVWMLLQAPEVDVLGICVVSGDGWCDESVLHLLRMLEICGRTDVPVYGGATHPLLNSAQRMKRWESLHGRLYWKGAWTEHLHDGSHRAGEHHDQPHLVPELAEGMPTVAKAQDESAAEFMVRTVRAHPGEVSIWAAGPLTNLALACRLDPQFASLAGELMFMGGSFRPVLADHRFALEYRYTPRHEFNMRWDPEAASLVLKEDWRRIVQLPVDATTRTLWTPQLQQQVAGCGQPWAGYFGRFGIQLPMWDEVAACAWLDPSVVTRREEMLVDIDTSFTANYGGTLSWAPGGGPGLGERLVDVVMEVDVQRIERMTVDLMTRAG